MSRILLLIVAVFAFSNINAQVDLKFGKVSVEELKKEKSLIDETAGAEVLGEFGVLNFKFDRELGLVYNFEYHKRIKIYNSSGYDNADVSIPFYDPSGIGGEDITLIKAYTYNLEGSKIEKIKLTNKEIIEEKISENVKVKKLTFPQVKEGTVIEYKYTQTSDYITSVPDWTFQESIPVVWSKYTFSIPEWYQFRAISQGFLNYAINEQKNDYGSDVLIPGATWQVKTSTWAVANAAPLKNERYISSKSNYIMKLNFQMLSYQFPGGRFHDVGQNYPKYNKTLMNSEAFGKLLKKSGFLRDEVALITNASSDEEKALALYTYMRNEMSWNKYTGHYPGDVRKAWKEKKGSVGQINSLLVMMMREAGLNAEPVIISTRNNGILHPVFPDADKFNYLLAGVKLGENWITLDASSKGYPFGTLPVKCLNGNGWIVSDVQSGWVAVGNGNKSKRTTQVKLNLRENGTIDGDMKIMSKGYSDISRRKSLYKSGKEDHIKNFNESLLDWEIDSVSFENEDNVYKSLVGNYHIVNKDSEDSDIIYMNPMIINQYEENPFEADERVMPIDFAYNTNDSYVMEITLPEGYVVDELPKPAVFQLPGKAARYQFSATNVGQKISIINNLKISKLIYNRDEYEGIKKFFELMIEKQSEQIVIKKI